MRSTVIFIFSCVFILGCLSITTSGQIFCFKDSVLTVNGKLINDKTTIDTFTVVFGKPDKRIVSMMNYIRSGEPRDTVSFRTITYSFKRLGLKVHFYDSLQSNYTHINPYDLEICLRKKQKRNWNLKIVIDSIEINRTYSVETAIKDLKNWNFSSDSLSCYSDKFGKFPTYNFPYLVFSKRKGTVQRVFFTIN